MEAPKCRLCQKNHWAREGCYGMLMPWGNSPVGRRKTTLALEQNIQREGRRVLKGSTGKPAKPTRTASTERTDPPKPAKAPADSAIAEKAGVGIPKPRKRKSTKKKAKVSK